MVDYLISIFEVSEEPDGDVQAGDQDHPGVQDPGPSGHPLRSLHLVLERQDDADALEREHGYMKGITG